MFVISFLLLGPVATLQPANAQRRLGTPRRLVVSGDDEVVVGASLVGAAALGRHLGSSTRWGRALGGPVTAMALTFAASSAAFLPTDAALVPTLRDAAVKLATPLLLLDADVGEIRRTSGPVLRAFCAAAAATIAASCLAWVVAGPSLIATLGSDAPKAAASLLAKNIGGGVNFVAVALATGMSPEAQATALAVDNVMALAYFPAVSAYAGSDLGAIASTASAATQPTVDAPDLLHATLAALVILALAQRLAPSASIAASSALAVAAATLGPRGLRRSLAPAAAVLAEALLYVFFAAAGCAGGSIAACAKAAGPPLFAFLACLYVGHIAGLLALAPLLRLPAKATSTMNRRPMLAIASNACIGGPATAAAMCTAKGWHQAVPPAICVGTFGYAIASFIGLGLHASVFRP